MLWRTTDGRCNAATSTEGLILLREWVGLHAECFGDEPLCENLKGEILSRPVSIGSGLRGLLAYPELPLGEEEE